MKTYIVHISDGRCSDWYFCGEDEITKYAAYGNYASIYLIHKELTEKEKKELVEGTSTQILPELKKTFPEMVAVDIPAPVYTKPHEPIDYSKVKWVESYEKGV